MRTINCCREIRLSICFGNYRGKIHSGYNTITDRFEEVIIVKAYEDYNKSVVQMLTPKNRNRMLKKYKKWN